jgi:hypothetical protein
MSVHAKIDPPRQAGRTRVLISGALLTPEGTFKVRIRDVSRGGAQVICTDKVPAFCDVLFKRGPVCAAARVVWVNGGEAGLRFYRELSPDEIEGALPAALLKEGATDL